MSLYNEFHCFQNQIKPKTGPQCQIQPNLISILNAQSVHVWIININDLPLNGMDTEHTASCGALIHLQEISLLGCHMSQRRKVLAYRPDHLDTIPETHKVAGEN